MWRQTGTSGLVVLLAVVCNVMLGVSSDENDGYSGSGDIRGRRQEFYKPPSACLTGPSCKNCVNTKTFYSLEVCCYHCRLDNLVISSDLCHCIDTRLPDSFVHMDGNCSSGQICDNCAVQISSDVSEGTEATAGITNFCCQDCGIAMPYLHRDEKGCHCVADLQGRVHQIAPRYDPAVHSTTPPTDSDLYFSAAAPVLSSLESLCVLELCAAVMAPLLAGICSSCADAWSAAALTGTALVTGRALFS